MMGSHRVRQQDPWVRHSSAAGAGDRSGRPTAVNCGGTPRCRERPCSPPFDRQTIERVRDANRENSQFERFRLVDSIRRERSPRPRAADALKTSHAPNAGVAATTIALSVRDHARELRRRSGTLRAAIASTVVAIGPRPVPAARRAGLDAEGIGKRRATAPSPPPLRRRRAPRCTAVPAPAGERV